MYIDDIIVNFEMIEEHVLYLRKTFDRIKNFKVKLNPLKCVFRVLVRKFLGFLVHKNGIQIDKN